MTEMESTDFKKLQGPKPKSNFREILKLKFSISNKDQNILQY